jgi:hypothetical protein
MIACDGFEANDMSNPAVILRLHDVLQVGAVPVLSLSYLVRPIGGFPAHLEDTLIEFLQAPHGKPNVSLNFLNRTCIVALISILQRSANSPLWASDPPFVSHRQRTLRSIKNGKSIQFALLPLLFPVQHYPPFALSGGEPTLAYTSSPDAMEQEVCSFFH